MTAPAVPKARKQQVRPGVQIALTAIVEQGKSIAEAAEIAGLRYESLRVALKRPHVQAFKASLKAAWLESESFKSWQRVVELRDGAASEKVSLDACKIVLTAAGDLEPERNHAPAAAVAIQFVVNNTMPALAQGRPGIIELPPFDPATFRPREIAAAEPAYVDAED